MSYGRYCNHCFLSRSIRIALVGDDRVSLIDAVQTRFSMCCEPVVSGKPSIRPSCAHIRWHMIAERQWVKAGVFLKLWQTGVEQFDDLCGIDWEWLSMDGAMGNRPIGRRKNGSQSDRS